jgi:hemerythrin-like domain-containing protein
MPSWLEEVRLGHAEILLALARLEDASSPLEARVDLFLQFYRSRFVSIMESEETLLRPLLSRYLPEDASPALLSHEHATIRAVAGDLQAARDGIGSARDAEADVIAAVSDLRLLVRDHIRREDGVLHPLFEALTKVAPHG